jgi:hypothetical protein
VRYVDPEKPPDLGREAVTGAGGAATQYSHCAGSPFLGMFCATAAAIFCTSSASRVAVFSRGINYDFVIIERDRVPLLVAKHTLGAALLADRSRARSHRPAAAGSLCAPAP